jgi:hypothetical protein
MGKFKEMDLLRQEQEREAPVQEPVQERLHEAFSKREQDHWLSEIAGELDDPTLTSFSQVATGIRDLKERLSTPPAAQTAPWVGLTHEEVNSWELPDRPTVFEFAKFIEAKLKEKNRG